MRSCTDSKLAPERQEKSTPPDDANALAWGIALFWQGLEARSVNPNPEILAFARREMARLAAREPADFLRRIIEQIAERFCAVIKVPEARARLALLRDACVCFPDVDWTAGIWEVAGHA
jgi:hypothetical protein